jgi:hypothetical protein
MPMELSGGNDLHLQDPEEGWGFPGRGSNILATWPVTLKTAAIYD